MTEFEQQVAAVLRGIEERTPHEEMCFSKWRSPTTSAQFSCNCDRPARVRAEQARTVERMVEAAIRATSDDVSLPDVWAAALRAGEGPRT